MRYLVDTNIWLEAGLMRTHGREAAAFLATVAQPDVAISDFTLNSLGFFLTPRTPDKFLEIVADIAKLAPTRLSLGFNDMPVVVAHMRSHKLDYDDAFQYTLADQFNLTLVSLDADFDRTPRGRKTPAQALAELGTAPPSP